MAPDPLEPPRYDPFWPGMPQSAARPRPLRRRLRVFLLSFVLLAVASLAYDFSRPAEYRASAQLRIDFPTDGDSADERRLSAHAAFLTEVQILGAQATVADTLDRLARAGLPLPAEGDNAAEAYHRALAATPLEGTTLVELSATGTQPEALAPFLNALIETYRDRLSDRYRQDSAGQAQQAQDEADALGVRVAAKRRLLDAFRMRHDIVSLERDENQTLKQVKGLGESLNAANEKLATAEARLRSLRESAAAGRSVVRARDNPALANLEQRASQLREEMHEMERRYTPDFLEFDTRAKSLRIRLANLEEQMAQVRENGRHTAVAEAEEDVETARATVDRLSQRAAGDRRNVQNFAARLGEFKAMQDELTGLEATHRGAVVRATRLRAAEQVRAPVVTTLDPALPPSEAWRPQYARDAAIGLAGSLVLALLATWIVELFNRTEPAPSLVVAPTWLTSLEAPPRDGGRLAQMAPAALLPQVAPLPRELDEREIALLLAELPDDARTAAVGLLSGLAPGDLARLCWNEVDLAARRLTLPDRELPLSPRFHDELCRHRARHGPADDAPVFAASQDAAALDATLLYAAHDAGLGAPDEVDSAALRHCYIAHLVRQGVRFADLPGIVGPLPVEMLGAYTSLAPAGKKHAADDIDRIHPALREAGPA